VADGVAPRDLNQALARGPSRSSLGLLMGGEGRFASEPNPTCLSSGPAFTGPRQDQTAFKLGKPTEDRQHQPTVWRGGVGPSICQGPKPRTSLRHCVQDIQKVTG